MRSRSRLRTREGGGGLRPGRLPIPSDTSGIERVLIADQPHVVYLRLRDQNPVERIAPSDLKLSCPLCVLKGDRKRAKSLTSRVLSDRPRRRWPLELADPHLGRDL